MKRNNPFNIIIAGVGGQGIVTLTKAILNICEDNSLQCTGSILKGGAQTLGSVKSIIRIFYQEKENYNFYSSEIPAGELDLLIGIEPWEALRQVDLFNKATKVVLNQEITPFWSERHNKVKIDNPINVFKNLDLKLVSDNYTKIAKDKYQNPKMANFEMLLAAIENKFLDLNKKSVSKYISGH